LQAALFCGYDLKFYIGLKLIIYLYMKKVNLKIGAVFCFIAVLLLCISFYSFSVHGATFQSSIQPSQVAIPYPDQSNQILNISITNTDSALNITKVNITLPAELVFIEGSAQTTAQSTTFSNTSAGSVMHLVWSNTTSSGFIENGTTQYFFFNISIPNKGKLYQINVTTTFTDDSTNTTILNFEVLQPFGPGFTPWSQFGPGPALNLSNTTDMFFYDGNWVEIVANFTNGESVGVPGLNVTMNFSQIGGPEFIQAEDLGNGWYRAGAFIDYSNLNVNIKYISDVNITVKATNDSVFYYEFLVPVLLFNMSVVPSCPPNVLELPPQMPLPNGTLVNITGCTNECPVENIGFAWDNGTDYVVCTPKFGGSTTNFNQIAATGDFSAVPLVIEIPGVVKINFTQPVDMSTKEKASAIMQFAMKNLMKAGRIGINDSEWNGQGDKPNLTTSARITIYNITGLLGIKDPSIGYGSFNGSFLPSDLQPCPPTRCMDVVFDGENLSFTVSTFSTYVVGSTLHNLTFENLTVMERFVQAGQNATYLINITNFGNNSLGEEYNLSVVGTGILNDTFLNLSIGEWEVVELNVSNSTEGVYTSYIIANHWNGTDTETDWNLSSADDGVIFTTYVSTGPPSNIIIVSPTPSNNSHINTNYFEINITFTDDTPQACILELNNGTQANYTMTMLGNYACYFNATNQGDGIISYSVYINDSVGNWGWNGTWYVTVDTTQPTVTIYSPQNTTYATTSIDLNYTVQDANLDSCWYSLNGGSNIILASCSNITITASEGLNNVIVYANDSAGNTGSAQEYFTVDTTPPTITILSPQNTTYNTTTLWLNFTYTEANLDTCWYQYNGTNTSLPSCSNQTFTALNNQQSTLILWMNDTAGNINHASITFTVDTIQPSVTLISPSNASTWTSSSTVTFTYNVTDASSITSCTLLINGITDQTDTSITKDTSQTFTKSLSNGNYNWSVRCRDAGGNTGISSVYYLTVSYTPPESSITYDTGGGAGYTPQEILPYVAYSWSRVNPGNVSIFKLNKKEIGIHEIGIMVINPATSVYIKVTKLKGKPADVTHEVSGKVYQYIEITHRNLRNNLEKATIKFHVNKSWIEENNINKSTISLYRYTTSWQKLPTTLISEDSKTVYYEAESTGFSYFAIAGEEVQVSEEVCNINGVCEEGETPENCPEDCKQPEEQPLKQVCTPGEKRCLGQELQQCNQEGTSWETLEICQYGCSEEKCKSPDYTWIWYLIIAILVAGAAAIYMFKIRAIQ